MIYEWGYNYKGLKIEKEKKSKKTSSSGDEAHICKDMLEEISGWDSLLRISNNRCFDKNCRIFADA